MGLKRRKDKIVKSNRIRNFDEESSKFRASYRRLRFLRLCTRIRYLRIKFIGWEGNPFPAYTFHQRCITYGTFNSWNSHLSHSSFMPDNRYRRGDRIFFSFPLLPDTSLICVQFHDAMDCFSNNI